MDAQALSERDLQRPLPPTMTEEQFKRALPANLRKNVSEEVLDKVNELLADPDMHEQYREGLLSYTSVMQTGKFKLTNYVDAVKYVTLRLQNKTMLDAYSIVFPDKIKKWVADGVAAKDISSYVSAYNKSKLVVGILEQTLTPSWILNQDLYQKALNAQADLMLNAKSEKVRSDAANSILTHLKMPETQRVELDIGIKEDSTIDALRQSTMALVAQQRKMLESGAMNAQEVAHTKLIIDGETVEE